MRGAVAEGLLRRGFDIVRAVDVLGEGVKDPPLFAHAASLGRVFVTNDGPLHAVALEWLRAGKPFRMIYWPKVDDKLYTVGQILEAFEELSGGSIHSAVAREAHGCAEAMAAAAVVRCFLEERPP